MELGKVTLHTQLLQYMIVYLIYQLRYKRQKER